MNFIKWEFYEVARTDTYRIYPLGDIHIGAETCDEKALRAAVERIKADDSAYWIGLGDYCDFIGPKDPRFSAGGLASWLTIPDLADIGRAQRERFLDIISPIARKCLGLVEGNHETAIKRHYERDVYLEIVNGIKDQAGLTEQDKLALHYNGFIWLTFRHSAKGQSKAGSKHIRIYCHHGYVGGRLKGAKGLNMQRLLWYTDVDIALMGHSHNTDIFTETTVKPNHSGRIDVNTKYGAFTGSFMRSHAKEGSSYAEIKGYPPLPLEGVMVELKPQAETNRIQMMTISR